MVNKNIGLMKDHERLKAYCSELQTQNTSFGLCLSAIVQKFGEPLIDEEDGSLIGHSHVLRLNDFQHAGGTNLEIETLPDIDGMPGTIIRIIEQKKPEDISVNGET